VISNAISGDISERIVSNNAAGDIEETAYHLSLRREGASENRLR